jgi:hypothetical protein
MAKSATKKASLASNKQLAKKAGCVCKNMHVCNVGTHEASTWESMSVCVCSVSCSGGKFTLVTPVERQRQVSAEVSGCVCDDMYVQSKLQRWQGPLHLR